MEDIQKQQILGSMDWPGTPGRQRLMRALRAQGENRDRLDPVGRADLEALENSMGNEEYRGWARQTLLEHICRHGGNHINLNVLEELAMRGTDEDFIGMAILSDEDECEVGCSFARLHRHPDWMGTDSAITLLKGLRVHLLEWGEFPGEPAIAVAMHPRMARGGRNQPDVPSETGRRLAEIAQWHGAVDCLWYPMV